MVSWSSLHNRAELLARLGLAPSEEEPTDAQLLLAAWRRWGTGCAAHLLGDFAFAVTDLTTQQTYLARDPMGVKPLSQRVLPGVISWKNVVGFMSKGLVGSPGTTIF